MGAVAQVRPSSTAGHRREVSRCRVHLARLTGRRLRCPHSRALVSVAALAAVLVFPSLALAGLTPAAGWRVSDFATGFATAGANGVGPIGVTFDLSGSFYAADITDGSIYRLPPQGGAVQPSNRLSATPVSGGPAGLAFTADGRLYLAREAGGDVVEISPSTGGILRTVASGFVGLAALAVDPISGDLFFTAVNRPLERISGLRGASPVVSAYASLTSPDGVVFAPDGTAYAVDHQGALVAIVKIAATNSPTPGAMTVIARVPAADGIAVGANPIDHAKPPFLAVNRTDGTITLIDLATLAQNAIATGGSRGDFSTVGGDGCLYVTQSDRISKLTATDGTCPFGRRFEPVSAFLPPGALTIGASQLTPTGGTLTGRVNPHGTAATAHFDYGPTSVYGSSTPSVDAGVGSSDTSTFAAVVNLQPCATFHYQLVAQSIAGTTDGGDQAFQTACLPPTVITAQPTRVGPGSATLTGSVNPNGLDSVYHFDYGVTQTYGAQTAAQTAGSGTQAQAESAAIANLTACTTYHYRLQATNPRGSGLGGDQTVQTSCSPTVRPTAERPTACTSTPRGALSPPSAGSPVLHSAARQPRRPLPRGGPRRPARPALRSPAAGARVRAGSVTFKWRPAARASSYTLMVDHHRINAGCHTVAVMRVSRGRHRYRVIARNRYGSRSSRTRRFTAVAASAPPPNECSQFIDRITGAPLAPDYAHFRPLTQDLTVTIAVRCNQGGAIATTNANACVEVQHDSGDFVQGECGNGSSAGGRSFAIALHVVCGPGLDGLRKYRVSGVITGLSVQGAPAVPRRTVSPPSEYRNGRCPGTAERHANELAGWRFLTHTNPARPNGRLRSPANSILGTVLGSRPTRDRKAWNAHHVVPAYDPRAQSAQEIAFRCGLHPNAVNNGVYLRSTVARYKTGVWLRLTPEQRRISYHPDTLYGDYFAWVDRWAATAVNSDDTCKSRFSVFIALGIHVTRRLEKGLLFKTRGDRRLPLHDATG